jgi:outer membrane protein TolC
MLALLAALALAADPLTLTDALDEAARASPDLRLAAADRDAARTGVTAARAAVLPRVDLTAAAGRGYAERERRAFDAHQLGLSARQLLLDGGSLPRIRAARAGERAAAHLVDEAALAVAFDVTARFYEVVRAEESARVLEETVDRSAEVLERAEALFVAGRSPKTEVIAARVNLENDRIQAEAQRARAAQARADLGESLGRARAVDEPLAYPEAVAGGALPAGEPPAAEQLLASARERRPLLAALRQLAAQARHAAAAARGAFWPALSAQGSWTRDGPELVGASGVFGDPTRAYVATAQVVAQWNLFAGRETTAEAERAEAAARRAEVALEQADAQVAAELGRARAAAIAQLRSAALARDALAAAAEGQRAALDRFAAGVATQLEVRDAALSLTRSELALLEARVGHAVASADLARATGAR